MKLSPYGSSPIPLVFVG